MTGATTSIDLPSGRLHALRFGAGDGPLAICIPGLSANCTSFAAIGEGLAAAGRRGPWRSTCAGAG